jgi:hypothetical protein
VAVSQPIDSDAADNIKKRISIDVSDSTPFGLFYDNSREQGEALQARG